MNSSQRRPVKVQGWILKTTKKTAPPIFQGRPVTPGDLYQDHSAGTIGIRRSTENETRERRKSNKRAKDDCMQSHSCRHSAVLQSGSDLSAQHNTQAKALPAGQAASPSIGDACSVPFPQKTSPGLHNDWCRVASRPMSPCLEQRARRPGSAPTLSLPASTVACVLAASVQSIPCSPS